MGVKGGFESGVQKCEEWLRGLLRLGKEKGFRLNDGGGLH